MKRRLSLRVPSSRSSGSWSSSGGADDSDLCLTGMWTREAEKRRQAPAAFLLSDFQSHWTDTDFISDGGTTLFFHRVTSHVWFARRSRSTRRTACLVSHKSFLGQSCSWSGLTNLLSRLASPRRIRLATANGRLYVWVSSWLLMSYFTLLMCPQGRKGEGIPQHEIFILTLYAEQEVGRGGAAVRKKEKEINNRPERGGKEIKNTKLTEAGEVRQRVFMSYWREKEIVSGIKKHRRKDGRGWGAERKKRKESRLSPASFHTSEGEFFHSDWSDRTSAKTQRHHRLHLICCTESRLNERKICRPAQRKRSSASCDTLSSLKHQTFSPSAVSASFLKRSLPVHLCGAFKVTNVHLLKLHFYIVSKQ